MKKSEEEKNSFCQDEIPLISRLIICCRSPAAATAAGASMITFEISSYAKRNEHAQLLLSRINRRLQLGSVATVEAPREMDGIHSFIRLFGAILFYCDIVSLFQITSIKDYCYYLRG